MQFISGEKTAETEMPPASKGSSRTGTCLALGVAIPKLRLRLPPVFLEFQWQPHPDCRLSAGGGLIGMGMAFSLAKHLRRPYGFSNSESFSQ